MAGATEARRTWRESDVTVLFIGAAKSRVKSVRGSGRAICVCDHGEVLNRSLLYKIPYNIKYVVMMK